MHRDELARALDTLLAPERFRDYCPNGLQLEGTAQVDRIVTGVSASAALLEAAIADGAQAVFVHHGWFWRGEDARIVGLRKRRIALGLAHGLNVYAYHLPLDAHPEFGNNAQLAARLGFTESSRTGEHELLCIGSSNLAGSLADLAARIERALDRAPMVIGEPQRAIGRVAWCTGAAQSYFEEAIRSGVDAFVTGEISEQTTHLARESGVAFIAAGHHATERYGVQAIGAHLAATYGIAHRFVDIDNPV